METRGRTLFGEEQDEEKERKNIREQNNNEQNIMEFLITMKAEMTERLERMEKKMDEQKEDLRKITQEFKMERTISENKQDNELKQMEISDEIVNKMKKTDTIKGEFDEKSEINHEVYGNELKRMELNSMKINIMRNQRNKPKKISDKYKHSKTGIGQKEKKLKPEIDIDIPKRIYFNKQNMNIFESRNMMKIINEIYRRDYYKWGKNSKSEQFAENYVKKIKKKIRMKKVREK